MTIRYRILVLFMVTCVAMSAQELKVENERLSMEADFLAGLNTDGWEASFGIAYFPIRYVGLKARVGFAGEIEELGDWGKEEWETGHTYATRFKFIPSLSLRSPRIVNWKSQDAGIYLFAEPGIVLSPGASGSKEARCFRCDFKGGVNMQFGRLIVFAGYGVSNFSLFSGFPDNHGGTPERDNYITHSGFIGTAWKF